jgi:hypothetical protein
MTLALPSLSGLLVGNMNSSPIYLPIITIHYPPRGILCQSLGLAFWPFTSKTESNKSLFFIKLAHFICFVIVVTNTHWYKWSADLFHECFLNEVQFSDNLQLWCLHCYPSFWAEATGLLEILASDYCSPGTLYFGRAALLHQHWAQVSSELHFSIRSSSLPLHPGASWSLYPVSPLSCTSYCSNMVCHQPNPNSCWGLVLNVTALRGGSSLKAIWVMRNPPLWRN